MASHTVSQKSTTCFAEISVPHNTVMLHASFLELTILLCCINYNWHNGRVTANNKKTNEINGADRGLF